MKKLILFLMLTCPLISCFSSEMDFVCPETGKIITCLLPEEQQAQWILGEKKLDKLIFYPKKSSGANLNEYLALHFQKHESPIPEYNISAFVQCLVSKIQRENTATNRWEVLKQTENEVWFEFTHYFKGNPISEIERYSFSTEGVSMVSHAKNKRALQPDEHDSRMALLSRFEFCNLNPTATSFLCSKTGEKIDCLFSETEKVKWTFSKVREDDVEVLIITPQGKSAEEVEEFFILFVEEPEEYNGATEQGTSNFVKRLAAGIKASTTPGETGEVLSAEGNEIWWKVLYADGPLEITRSVASERGIGNIRYINDQKNKNPHLLDSRQELLKKFAVHCTIPPETNFFCKQTEETIECLFSDEEKEKWKFQKIIEEDEEYLELFPKKTPIEKIQERLTLSGCFYPNGDTISRWQIPYKVEEYLSTITTYFEEGKKATVLHKQGEEVWFKITGGQDSNTSEITRTIITTKGIYFISYSYDNEIDSEKVQNRQKLMKQFAIAIDLPTQFDLSCEKTGQTIQCLFSEQEKENWVSEITTSNKTPSLSLFPKRIPRKEKNELFELEIEEYANVASSSQISERMASFISDLDDAKSLEWNYEILKKDQKELWYQVSFFDEELFDGIVRIIFTEKGMGSIFHASLKGEFSTNELEKRMELMEQFQIISSQT